MGDINPYTDRTKIRDINRFYGRKQEVSRIYSRIGAPNPQSVSIVGDRRVGKSSLLHFIHHEENRKRYLSNPESYTFVLMDMQEEPNDTIPSFIESLIGLIKESLGRDIQLEGRTGYDALKRLAMEFRREKRKLVILFDEFELIPQNETFDSAFYAFLRGLASNYDISYVTSSVRDLQELCSTKAIANSPFFNIFSKIHLGPFREDEEKKIVLMDLVRRGYVLEKDNKYKLFSKTFAERMVASYTRKTESKDENLTSERHEVSLVIPPAPFNKGGVTEERIQQLAEELERKELKFGEFIGRCEKMEEVYRQIEGAAYFNRPVLIQAETGTGKELVAKAIHSLSGRNPFVAVDCASIPKELAESELFGHERGAFTGADKRKEGKFMMADGGTIFFDEIGELDIPLQAKLLRVLETKTFQRVGGHEQIQVEVRVIAATNRKLEEAIRDAQFRKDLYYRLNVFEITLPPLRERGEDILLLALHFLKQFAKENPTIKAQTISPQVAKALLEYPWPGNVRELKGVIERAAIASKKSKLIPEDFKGISGFDPWPDSLEVQVSSLDSIKNEIARMRYESYKNYTKAAESLGIDERTLRSWFKKSKAPDKSGLDLQISIAQYSSFQEIECEVIRQTLEYTKNNNPKAAEILGIALSTFIRKRGECGL